MTRAIGRYPEALASLILPYLRKVITLGLLYSELARALDGYGRIRPPRLTQVYGYGISTLSANPERCTIARLQAQRP